MFFWSTYHGQAYGPRLRWWALGSQVWTHGGKFGGQQGGHALFLGAGGQHAGLQQPRSPHPTGFIQQPDGGQHFTMGGAKIGQGAWNIKDNSRKLLKKWFKFRYIPEKHRDLQ